MKPSPSATPQPSARDCCKSIVALMGATERLRQRYSVAVLIDAETWKRIYLNARRGAK